MNKRIAILGCGWLGFPLAEALLHRGWEVHGSTTTPERLATLEEAGIKAFEIKVEAEGVYGDIQAFLSGVDVIFIDIPPGLRKSGRADFKEKIAALLPSVQRSEASQVIFISSTSVYGNVTGEVTETDPPEPDTQSGRQLMEAEALLQQLDIPVIIIRYGGLLGGDRHPVKYLAGKAGLPDGGAPVNLIQQEDAVYIPIFLLEKGIHSGIYNAVAPEHPSKKEYYTAAARQRNLKPPSYKSADAGADMKKVDSVELPALGYAFRSSIYD